MKTLYRLLLNLYPADFRREYGAEMERDFAHSDHKLAAIFDGIWSAMREHADLLSQDLRFACRTYSKSPGLTSLAVLAMATGIGANVAMLAVVNAVLWRPLPYATPDRLVSLETRNVNLPEQDAATSGPDFLELARDMRSTDAWAGISPIWSLTVQNEGLVERREALYVSADFFPILGVNAHRGRVFRKEEDAPNRDLVALISHSYWQSQFGGRNEAIGRKVIVDGAPMTIIGVMPPRFRYLGSLLGKPTGEIDIWMPLARNPLMTTPRSVRWLSVLARLAPNVSAESAGKELAGRWSGIVQQYAATNAGFTASFHPLVDQALANVRPAMTLLAAGVGLLLLVTCANVANLLLARLSQREPEFSVRLSLGAGAGRLARQLMTESLLLTAAGGVCGFAIVAAAATLIPYLPKFPRREELGLDASVLMLALGATLLTGLLSGLAPLWQTWRANLAQRLKLASRSSTGTLRGGLIVSEVALATLLLVSGGLLAQSLRQVLAVDPGFNTSQTTTVSTLMPMTARRPEDRATMMRQISESVRQVPGVTHVGVVSRLPLLGANISSWLHIEGRTFARNQQPDIEYRVASTEYFGALGIPLKKGRFYTADPDRYLDAVVNETLVKLYFPNEDPIGKRIKFGPNPANQQWTTIVGVVGDIRHFGLEAPARAEVYRPYAVNPLNAPILVVRGANGPPAVNDIRRAIRGAQPAMPMFNDFEMSELVRRDTAGRRFVLQLMMIFCGLAILLAGLGLYGVMATGVSQRVREIGLRLAVGATPADVQRLVLTDGARLAAIGLAIGLAVSALAARYLRSQLFGVSPWDPLVFIATPLLLLAIALLATMAPAWRASRVDPLTALREQ